MHLNTKQKEATYLDFKVLNYDPQRNEMDNAEITSCRSFSFFRCLSSYKLRAFSIFRPQFSFHTIPVSY